METTQRRAPDTGDVNDAENEEVEVEEVVVEDDAEECLLKEVVKLGARGKIDIPMYEGGGEEVCEKM
jgi:putative transposon-encoded protein